MKIRLLLVFSLLAIAVFAADVSGKWTADVQGRGGNSITVTFNLKADGNNLTGTVSGPRGETNISNGKVDGDNVSFDLVREFNGNTMTSHYTGTLTGDTLNLKVQGPRGNTRELSAKRASS
jgi:hypothetical protein